MYFKNAIEAIGHTPLVELTQTSPNQKVRILAKLEGQNLGGSASIKDRIAKYMIEKAEQSGELTKDRIIIEATSGNTGIALAWLGYKKGYKVTIVMPDNMSVERQQLLKIHDAELILTKGAYGSDGAIDTARELAAQDSRYFMPDQFSNPANPLAHYETTATEILDDFPYERIDALIAGIGTGGTIVGVARRLKEAYPNIKIIGITPPPDDTIQGLKCMTQGIYHRYWISVSLLRWLLSPASFKVDPAANKVVPPLGVSPVVSPFDEQAVEAALRIKDAQGGKVTALSLGANLARDVIKKPLSMGADELILLEDDAFAEGDSWSTAYALAMAIKKIGDYDLIFCGRQAADWDAGQVGSGIAEILGLPSVTVAQKIETTDGKARVERITADGYEVVEVSLPAMITVSNELGEPRYATLKGIMAATKKQPIIWKPTDIGVAPSQIGAAGRRTKLLKLFQPVREGKCEIIEGESPEEAAVNLALKLREAKIL